MAHLFLLYFGNSAYNSDNADTKDHPAGVWTLPPSLRQCGQLEDAEEIATCKQHYRSIGESDRMTLKFVKPGLD
jgi:predicted methyltransferase